MEQCLAAIASADFIALDMEFSGLFTSMKKCSRIEEFYRHTSESVQKFLCLQLGVCCGRKKAADSTLLEWVLDPFNFYVFPSRRKIHSVDTSSFSWLREQGFDFNDWIERGYDYERLANIDCPYIKTKDTITTLGLQRVVEKIIDAGKPIIFHNGALDLLHLYDKFVADLPSELGELAVELNRLFPAGIYDTKRIAVECNLVPKGTDDPEHIRVRYTLDGLSSATSAFEPASDNKPNPLLPAPAKPARIPASPTAALSCTTLNVLRRTLEKKLGRHLKLTVESNVTTSYDLKLRILTTTESSPEGESTEPPSPADGRSASPNKRARIDPITSNREHEAGFDAMLTMHLFLLELEILLSKNSGNSDKNLSARTGAALIDATSITKAKDRLECKGVPPGYIDFAAARRQAIDTGLSTDQPTECSAKESQVNNEEQYSAPLFKNKTLFRPNSAQYTKPVCGQP